MTLTLQWGDYRKYLQCPFATWWKARKYFIRPRFEFFFGRNKFWPFVSTEYIKWRIPKWFPIYITSNDIMWKDKWNSPRFERNGYFLINIGRNYNTSWQIGFIVKAPKVFIYDCTNTDTEDFYWESILTYLYYKKKNLFNTRKSLQSHWATHKSTEVKRFSIINTMFKPVLNKEYYVIALRCKYLLNKLDFKHSLTSDIKLTIEVRKDKSCVIAFSSFLQVVDDLVYVYIHKSPHITDFVETLESEYDNVKLEVSYEVDLGPTFKDQFLNKRGIKLIQSRR